MTPCSLSRMSCLCLLTGLVLRSPQMCAQMLPSGFPLAGSKQTYRLCGKQRLRPFLSYSAKGESTIHLLSHLYAQRASELWKVPEVAEWLRSTIDGALLKRLASETSPARIRARNAFENGTPESIVRHVIVAENRAVMTFFSPNAVPRTMVSYDPVPPRTSLSQYDEAYFQGVAIGKGRRRDPGVHGRPALGDEEELIQVQEMIMQEIQRRQRAAGDVPGAFPGAEHDPEPPVHEGEVDSEIEASEDEEDEDDDQDLVSRSDPTRLHLLC